MEIYLWGDILGLSAWITHESPLGTMDKVKRPKGPPAVGVQRTPRLLVISFKLIADLLSAQSAPVGMKTAPPILILHQQQ